MRRLNAILKVIDFINKWVLFILAILFGVMAAIIIFQVFSRFFLGLPLAWSEEIARLIMAYTVFLGAGIALGKGRLIAVEFLLEKLSDSKRNVLIIIIQIIAIFFFILLFIQGMKMIDQVHSQLSSAMRIPMSLFYASIPIGSILLMINSIGVMLEIFSRKEGEA